MPRLEAIPSASTHKDVSHNGHKGHDVASDQKQFLCVLGGLCAMKIPVPDWTGRASRVSLSDEEIAFRFDFEFGGRVWVTGADRAGENAVDWQIARARGPRREEDAG